MSQVSDNARTDLVTHDDETKPSSNEIIEYIRELEEAEWRAKLISTIIITTSALIAAAVAGLLAHDNVVVTVLIFASACLLSVRFMLKLF